MDARLHQGQAEDRDQTPAHRGPGAWNPQDGGRGSVLHRRSHPGQRHQGRSRKRGSPAARRPHRALRDRGDRVWKRTEEGTRAKRCDRALSQELRSALFVVNAILHALQISLFMLWEVLWILCKGTLRGRTVDDAKRQADRGVFGSTHEAHGEMDISITDGPFLSRLFSPRAFTAIAHSFYMDLNALYVDLGLGFLIAGPRAAWAPNSRRQACSR